MLTEKDREHWIIDWLERNGPAEWHGYVERHQWDGGSTAPLDWIVAHPQCDAGTAATIFWMSEPDYYLDGRHDDHPIAQLDLAIARRWSEGGFPSGRFASDEGHLELIEAINAGPHKVPHSLADPVEGSEQFTWFEELPKEIDLAWHRANGREPPEHLLEPERPASTIEQRPGKLSSEEARLAWAELGPSSAFSPMPVGGEIDGATARGRIVRSDQATGDEGDAPRSNGGWKRLSRWLGRSK
jgi:hypothetical protein